MSTTSFDVLLGQSPRVGVSESHITRGWQVALVEVRQRHQLIRNVELEFGDDDPPEFRIIVVDDNGDRECVYSELLSEEGT